MTDKAGVGWKNESVRNDLVMKQTNQQIIMTMGLGPFSYINMPAVRQSFLVPLLFSKLLFGI